MTPPAATDPALAAVLAAEADLLRPECRADPDRLRGLLHPDFREHGASGTVWTLDALCAELAAAPDVHVRPAGLQAHRLAPDVVLVTYRTEGPRPSLRSSLWLRDPGGRWRLRFHQGTLLPTGGGAGEGAAAN